MLSSKTIRWWFAFSSFASMSLRYARGWNVCYFKSTRIFSSEQQKVHMHSSFGFPTTREQLLFSFVCCGDFVPFLWRETAKKNVGSSVWWKEEGCSLPGWMCISSSQSSGEDEYYASERRFGWWKVVRKWDELVEARVRQCICPLILWWWRWWWWVMMPHPSHHSSKLFSFFSSSQHFQFWLMDNLVPIEWLISF